MKCLIVNADDFGFTRDVNEGILEAHRSGILTATTLMANGAQFEHAVELARLNPSLDIGCHLVLVGGSSLLDPGRHFPRSLSELVPAVIRGRVNVLAELEAQVQRILRAGLHPTHLDTHKHTHLLPPVLDAVASLARKYGIPWVRRPFDFPLHAGAVPFSRRAMSACFGFLRPRFHRVLEEHGCRTTDHFAGFRVTGYLRTEEILQLIAQLPDGITEFMTHPGFCTTELQNSPTRLKESREIELRALTAPEVRSALARHGVQLHSYSSLASTSVPASNSRNRA